LSLRKTFENDKKLIEVTFGIPVVNEYGAEVDLSLLRKITHNEWIVNAESLFIEILTIMIEA
jgi:phenylacetate-CoA ligase